MLAIVLGTLIPVLRTVRGGRSESALVQLPYTKPMLANLRSTRRCYLAASQAGANSRFMCVALKASASYCSGTTVRFVLHPLCEPLHSGMVSKRLHGIIASCKVCVAARDVYVSSGNTGRPSCLGRVA